jgi:hypothetical protein
MLTASAEAKARPAATQARAAGWEDIAVMAGPALVAAAAAAGEMVAVAVEAAVAASGRGSRELRPGLAGPDAEDPGSP